MQLLVAIIISPYTVARWVVKGSIGGVKAAIALQVAVKRWGKKDRPTYGDASFAEERKLKNLGYFENSGFLACVTRRGKPVFTHPERTVLMVAPPGIGKSQHFIAHIHAMMERADGQLPHLMLGDAVGELRIHTAAMLSARGYDCVFLDLREPDEWSKYDVLSHLKPDWHLRYQYADDLTSLCELIVPDEPGSRQPHFVDFARLLLKCAITVNVRYEGNSKPLGDIVLDLISETRRASLIERAKSYSDDYVTAALETMAKMDGKPEGISMMSTALRKLESWNDPALRELTTFGKDMDGDYIRGWTFGDVFSSEKPVAVFIRTGGKRVGGDFSRIVYGNAINALSSMYQDSGKPPAREVEFIIDEAGLTGYCNAISKAYARFRKAGARIRLCFLSYQEFKETYPDHETLLAGSDILAFGSTNDMQLLEKVSKLAGEYTVHSKSLSESDKGSSRGKSEHPRRLQKEDEIRAKADDEVLVLLKNIVVDGLKPWRIGKNGPEYLGSKRTFFLKRLFKLGK